MGSHTNCVNLVEAGGVWEAELREQVVEKSVKLLVGQLIEKPVE